MRELHQFVLSFVQNKGIWLTASTFYSRFVMFLVSFFIVIPLLGKDVYGKISYSLTFIGVAMVFSGFGSNVGFLRFGPLIKEKSELTKFASYSFTRGFLNTVFLIVIVLLGIFIVPIEDELICIFILLLLGRILAQYLQVYQSVYFRVLGQNKELAIYEIVTSSLYFLIAITLVSFFLEYGYILALVLSPILGFLVFFHKLDWEKPVLSWSFDVTAKKKFWIYSILSSFTTLIGQLVFSLDIFLVEYFMTTEDIAEYRAASLIPLNIIILPLIFMKADFTKIASHTLDRKFLWAYYKNYLVLFFVISIGGFLFSYFCGEWILSFLGEEYNPFQIFMVLIASGCMAMMFRVPLGNIISALGKAHINTYIGVFTLVLDLVLNMILIPQHGLMGAAWATFWALTISGFLNLLYFLYYLNQLKKQDSKN